MNHIEFMQFLKEKERVSDHNKVVTRLYKNTQNADVMILLPQCYWTYVDWLEPTADIKFADWVTHCEQTPFEDWTLSHLLMYWLWLDECRRHRYGEATLRDQPPEGYETYGERANDS